VVQQGLAGVAAEAEVRLAHARAQAAHEKIGEEKHVLPPLAKRRQLDREHIQAVVEVVAEPPGLHFLSQVPVGGGDEPDVGLQRCGRHALKLALEGPEH
jgi:hypothetical protein